MTDARVDFHPGSLASEPKRIEKKCIETPIRACDIKVFGAVKPDGKEPLLYSGITRSNAEGFYAKGQYFDGYKVKAETCDINHNNGDYSKSVVTQYYGNGNTSQSLDLKSPVLNQKIDLEKDKNGYIMSLDQESFEHNGKGYKVSFAPDDTGRTEVRYQSCEDNGNKCKSMEDFFLYDAALVFSRRYNGSFDCKDEELNPEPQKTKIKPKHDWGGRL